MMQIIKRFFFVLFFLSAGFAFSQTTYMPQWGPENHFIDRMQILHADNRHLIFSNVKPYSRKYLVQQAEALDSLMLSGAETKERMSASDQYDLRAILMANTEWVSGNRYSSASRKSLGPFYQNKYHFFEVNTKDFYLALNPILQIHSGVTSDSNGSIFLNSRGLSIRSRIAGKIGLSSTIIENQERGPAYFNALTDGFYAVPGVGFYKPFKQSGYDYFDARGYLTFNATPYIDFQFGYDKNFIGNGYRSLFLSDWGNSYLFFKVNTRIWKLNYQNLFMELMPQRFPQTVSTLMERKYAAMHHLSVDVNHWLTMGLFEGVVFGRKNRFDFQYLNPIIFYRHVEGTVGSPDNALAGLDIKANVMRRCQFYGQLMLDEFLIKKIKNDPGNWVNKFGIQAGLKYMNALGVKNLDVQLELNRVRPFTYSHFDTIANYSHYNQPLAHPLGANFQEFVGIVRYRPAPKWNISCRTLYYYKGLDTAGRNMGGNIFKSYTSRDSESGYSVGGGRKAVCLNTLFNVSFECRPNIFLELSAQYRSITEGTDPRRSSTFLSAGFRMNMWKREYDY